jgi:hypothetical protein
MRITTVALGLVFAVLLAAPVHAGPPAALEDQGDPSRSQALRSLERFAESWMGELHRMEAQGRANGTRQGGYRGFGPGYAVTLKATGNPRAPWVGLIRYAEHEYACRTAGCSRSASRNVTEIFRFQGGRWIY